MDREAAGYDEDFYAWTQAQAEEIRRAGAERNNAPIDWENVAEEIECMGKSERLEIYSRLKVLLVHLLKWLECPELRERCTRSWSVTIDEQRDMLHRRLRQSPSLRPYARDIFSEAFTAARRAAAQEADVPTSRFPADPPFTLDQALDPAYPPDLFPPEQDD